MSQLTHPFGSKLEVGEVLEVAEGVLWLRMPLPFSLDHINIWTIRDGDGWTLVDTGIQNRRTVATWEDLMVGALGGLPIKRIICTHMHPDHVGLAGWLAGRFDCRLWMTRLEYLTCRVLSGYTGQEAPKDALQFYRSAGWDDRALGRYKARFGDFGRGVHPLPDSFLRVQDGDVIEIGGSEWHAIVGRGHSPEHLCLYSPKLRALISGDQVLPGISSNVSVFPMEPDADPMSDWLESLEGIRKRVPDDVVVLPSHNAPFQGLHARLAGLIDGHERALVRLRELIREPRRAVDVFSVMFRRPVDEEMLGLATGESLAHLNCLVQRKQAVRTVDSDGVAWYSAR